MGIKGSVGGTCGAGGALAATLEVWMRSLSLVLVSLIVACGSPPAPAAKVEVDVPAPVVAAPVVEVAKVEAAPAVAKVEVQLEAGCAEYLASYRRCIAEMAKADAPAHTTVVEQMEASWKLAQADAKVAGTLAGTCSSARAASKLALPECKHW